MLIKGVKLLTAELERLFRFYTITLGLPVVESNNDSFSVQIGRSQLIFERNDKHGEYPFYHFAFDISSNKIQESMEWLESRGIELNKLPESTFKIYSPTWNATSIFFYDPAGNIVEFIARHNLNNATPGQFQLTDLVRISEIGLVVPDVSTTRELLRSKFSLTEYKNYHDRFAAVGDEEGLFILSVHKRIWLGSDKSAEIFKTEVIIEHNTETEYSFLDLPYKISVKGKLDKIGC